MTLMPKRIQRLFNLRNSYRRSLQGADGERVLADLAQFCKLRSSPVAVSRVTGAVDTHATMLAEGRREVFQHIVKVLRLTDEQIYRLMENQNERDE